jgi:hypothetical protein
MEGAHISGDEDCGAAEVGRRDEPSGVSRVTRVFGNEGEIDCP